MFFPFTIFLNNTHTKKNEEEEREKEFVLNWNQ